MYPNLYTGKYGVCSHCRCPLMFVDSESTVFSLRSCALPIKANWTSFSFSRFEFTSEMIQTHILKIVFFRLKVLLISAFNCKDLD